MFYLAPTTVAYADFVFDKTEGQVNMCKAIEDIKKKAREEGIEQGIEQGLEQGIEQGVFQITCEYVKEGLLKVADAAKKLNMSQEELEKLLAGM